VRKIKVKKKAMGVRKRETADARKEANKSIAFIEITPTSPRKCA
jgi:large subunit ribosomal protein L22